MNDDAIKLDLMKDVFLHPSLDSDILMFLVVTFYDKKGKPFVSFPWRGFSEAFQIPNLLSDVAQIGLLFAPDKSGMLSMYDKKKMHPLPMEGECIIELLDLVKERMNAY